MRTSSTRTPHYRQVSSRNAEMLSTFRRQMADFARGELLREQRTERHLSQAEAAHQIGVSEKSVRSWEKGGKIRWYNAKKVGTLPLTALTFHNASQSRRGALTPAPDFSYIRLGATP